MIMCLCLVHMVGGLTRNQDVVVGELGGCHASLVEKLGTRIKCSTVRNVCKAVQVRGLRLSVTVPDSNGRRLAHSVEEFSRNLDVSLVNSIKNISEMMDYSYFRNL